MKKALCFLIILVLLAPAHYAFGAPLDSCSLSFIVSKGGAYRIALTFRCDMDSAFELLAYATLDGYEMKVSLPRLWKDVAGEKQTDKYGNEIAPDQVLVSAENTIFLRDYTRFTGLPETFELTEGTHTLVMQMENAQVEFISAQAIPAEEISSCAAYASLLPNVQAGRDFIELEAENYVAKNDSYIRGTSSKNTATVPYDPLIKRISVIDDKSFNKVGQTLYYEFDIETPGLYTLAMKYCQPLKAGMPVFRTVFVDGKLPFSEYQDVPFPHTGLQVYANKVLPGQVYLEKGKHTLELTVTAGPVDALYSQLIQMIADMNSVTLKIKKITGQNSDISSNIDVNRTWNVLDYMPTILTDVAQWQNELLDIYDTLCEISGEVPSFASDLLLAVRNLKELVKDPSKLPNKMNLLGDDSSSAAQLLGTLLSKLSEQNMSLDRIYIYDGVQELPSASESFLSSIGAGLRQFLYSFSPVMNESVSRQEKGGSLTVWVNKSSQYVEVLRELCAQTFTKETGIDVTFSIMPGEDKIILANASGKNPDVALCISYYLPYNFAVRGVAKNLLEYDGFLDFYTSQYTLESLTPMSYDGGVYAASDSQDFYVLFYRKDILNMLGLTVPDTMDDVRAMMPTLHRNAMNFSMPLSTDKEGYKSFAQTMPFVYQNGGDFYSADGMHGGLKNPNTIKGLKEMCDMYRVYGCAMNVKSLFNSFRSGSVPIGISNFSTYLQLSVTAPEMAGLWDIALAPGTKAEDGTVLRYQSADTTAAMIFENTQMPDEAYQFLLWWLSEETQTKYANDLQRKYGPNYLWNTANLKAFEKMAYPQAHKDVILTMWREWQLETPRHIASYLLEREISNIWMDVVRDYEAFQPRIDQAQTEIDREMVRKLQEFGYLDEQGNCLKPYLVNTVKALKEEMP